MTQTDMTSDHRCKRGCWGECGHARGGCWGECGDCRGGFWGDLGELGEVKGGH